MNTSIRGPLGRRWARTVGAALAAVLVLAGCSSGGGYDSAGPEAAWAQTNDSGGLDYEGDGAVAGSEHEMAEQGSAPAISEERSALIVRASLYVTVEDPAAVAQQATTIVHAAGGRVDSRNETAPSGNRGGSAQLVLRIPVTDFDAVVQDLRDLGTVDDFNFSSDDVSNQVTDLEARISTLRASTARIEALLGQAADIPDIIDLESELAERQATLEALEARLRGLDDQVSMSTLELSLTTEPVVVVDDSPRSFWDGVVTGWNGLVTVVSGSLVVLGVLLPWLVVVAIIVVGIILWVRAATKRGAQRRAAAPHAAQAQQPAQPATPTQATTPAETTTTESPSQQG